MDEPKDIVQRIDGETGEIISEFEIGKDESLTTSEKIHKRNEFLKNKNKISQFSNQLGGFVKLFYVNNEILFQNVLNPQEVARFLYISTFIDYDNVLKEDGKPLTKKNLWKLTFMRPTIFNQLYEKLTNENFLFENEDGTISVNNEKVTKGDHKMKDVSYTRMYINTIRKLYRGCDQRQHKTLGYLFKLIPFLDFESNMICFKNNEKFSPMTTEEMMGIVNDDMNTTKGAVTRFNRQLLNFSITLGNKEYPVFGKLSFETKNGKVSGWAVNPCLFYQGNNIENVNLILKKLFEFSNK